jgi:hemolysin activation/secretion protein
MTLVECCRFAFKTALSNTSFCLVAFSSMTFSVLAQRAPDAGALQQNMQRQMQTPSALGLPEPSAPEFAPLDLSKSETLFIVKRFALTGVNLVAAEEVDQALKPWLNREISFAELQKAMNAIESVYRDKGYLAQATLSPQVLQDGVVRIEVLEAKLGSVITEPAKEGSRFKTDFASSYVTRINQTGEPVNIDRITRSLTILNEVPGVSAVSVLEAGEQQGETNLRVTLTDTNWLMGRAETNNYGSRTTGQWQTSASASLNNISGYGDQAFVSGIYAQGSQYTQGSYNFPLGARGLRTNLSGSYLKYNNIGDFAVNGSEGTATVVSAELSYPWLREQTTNVNLTARIDNKSYLNNNLATGIVVSQYTINNLTFGVSGNHFDGLLGGAVTTASLGLVLGRLSVSGRTASNYGVFVDALGNVNSYLPASFGKLTFNLRREQTLRRDKLFLSLNMSGQVANVNLNSAEQFYLGGPYGVRAYPVSQGGGSQGAMLNVELQQKLPYETTGFLFFDAGTVQQYKNPYLDWQGLTNAGNLYSLAAAGFGMKYASKGLAVGAAVAWRVGNNPLYSQTGVAVNADSTNTNPMVWLNLSYQFGR